MTTYVGNKGKNYLNQRKRYSIGEYKIKQSNELREYSYLTR